jgi:hypothetical protein
MLANGLPDGTASSEERPDGDGTALAFSAALGAPGPRYTAVGAIALDGELGWQRVSLEVDGRARDIHRKNGLELEVEGVPALHGVTVRRLIAQGLAPGGRREIEVLRVGLDGSERRLRVRYTWAGGARFRYEVPADLEAAWLLVRPATGVVVSVEGAAELTS